MAFESEYDRNLNPLHQAALQAVWSAVVVNYLDGVRERLNPEEVALLTKNEETLSDLIKSYGLDLLDQALDGMSLQRLSSFSVVRREFLSLAKDPSTNSG